MSAPKHSRELNLLVEQIDFNSEHYYNLYSEPGDLPADSGLSEDAWANLSAFTADLAKVRGELYRLGKGVENLRLPAIEAVGLDKVAEQLRGLDMRLRPLGEILSRPEEESRSKRLLKDILTVVDALDRVFELVENQPGSVPEGVEAGLRSVYRLFLETLGRYGLSQMEIEREFDPHSHQAMGTEANPELSDGMVNRILLNGYTFNGDPFRVAQVTVVKNEN